MQEPGRQLLNQMIKFSITNDGTNDTVPATVMH